MAILNSKNLPYTTSRILRLQHYARYLLMPAVEKTHWLIELARHDTFYAGIISTLETYGYQVHHQFYGHNGAYLPDNIELIENCETEEAVKELHEQGELQARFALSSRYGGAQISHYWLHELIHFWQDLHGLFLTPLRQKDTAPVWMDASSHIAVTCFNEAMAETEALRASWRLKEKGYTIAWQGALSSLDWGKHARYYAQNLQRMPELEAARHSFDRWYESKQRPYYEKRALKAYQKTLDEFSVNNPAKAKSQMKRITPAELLKIMPKAERPEYLTLSSHASLNSKQYTSIHHKDTAKQVHALEEHLGAPQDQYFSEMRTGAATYIWKWSTDEITAHTD